MGRPCRIQLKRTKGYRKPKDAVTVTRATRWGNPYLVKDWGQHRAVALFREDLFERGVVDGPKGPVTLAEVRAALKGKDLACYCQPGDPCHADVPPPPATSNGSLKAQRHVSGGMGIGEQPSRLGTICHQEQPVAAIVGAKFDFILDRGIK